MTHFYNKVTKEFLDSKQLDKAFCTSLPNSTQKEPLPPKENFAICFNEEKDIWEYIEDNRNKIVYSTIDKTESKIDYLGVIKDGFTLNQPKEFDKWNSTTWEADIDSIKTSKLSSINITCKKAIISGFKSSSLQDEYLYQSDRDDQLNLMGLVANGIDNFLKCGLATIILENTIEKEVITWDYKLHTIAQLKQVLGDGAKYKLDLLTKANNLKNQVQNATTVNELDGINW